MDIFLSYSSADHHVVEMIARKLRDESLEPFLDRWHLAPGMRWRPRLEETLSACKAKIPAKTVVKFRVTTAGKDGVLRARLEPE